MAGTKEGARTAREKYGDDYFSKIGKMGTQQVKRRKGGFSDPKLASEAGKKGRRTPPKNV